MGITLQPNSVIRWAYSFHKLSMMIKDFKELNNHSLDNRKHKEESIGRMKADSADREKLRKKLEVCIDPLEETGEEFATSVVNIVSGKIITAENTNVFDCVKIGREQLIEFRSSLPEGFHDTLTNRVILAITKSRNIQSIDGKRTTSLH